MVPNKPTVPKESFGGKGAKWFQKGQLELPKARVFMIRPEEGGGWSGLLSKASGMEE